MLNKKSITKKSAVVIAVLCIMMTAVGMVCSHEATPAVKAESNIVATASEMSQEQEDGYYRNMGYEPVRELGDLFKKYKGDQLSKIKGLVLLNDIDCATDTSWHDFVNNWQETGYMAPSLDFEFNGMGHKILNGENLVNLSGTDRRKTTVLLGGVKGVKNLYLENIALATSTREYLLNVHVRSTNGKSIFYNCGLSKFAPKLIKNCSVEATIEYSTVDKSTWISVGGLVAYVSMIDKVEPIIENSYFYGQIIHDAKQSGSSIGGLVGEFDNTDGKIKNSFAYYNLDLLNGDNARVGLITGSQCMKYWREKEYINYTIEYDTVYAGNSGQIAEIGAKIEGDSIDDNIIEKNCDIEEIKTVPAALLGDKETVAELDFDKVWNLGEKDNHPTLRTLSVTVVDNTLISEKPDGYNLNYPDQYFNEGEEFELSYNITDISLGYAYLEIDGKDSLEKLSENKLTIEVNENTFIALQVGYRPKISIYVSDPDTDLFLDAEVENAIAMFEGATIFYALGDKVKIKLKTEDGYHIEEVNLPKEAVKIGENEYEIAVGKAASSESSINNYEIKVSIAKDFPKVGLIIGVVAGVVVLSLIVSGIVISKKRKQKKSA